MNVENFIDFLKGRQHNHSTLATSKRVILIFLKWVTKERMEPEQVTYQDMLGFMKSCNRKGVSQKTVQHYLNTVRHYYDFLIEEKEVEINPVTGIEVKGVKRKVLYHILEPHELHTLYNQYPDKSPQDKRNKVMLGLMVYQGIRTQELGKLTTDNIKLREGQIDILGSRKNNGRLLQLESHQVLDMYDFMLKTRPELLVMKPKRKTLERQETDLLFIGEGGYCYSISNFVTQLMIKVRKINPNVLNAKQIRASVITKWVKTHNLRKAQFLAGHRYISSTETYLQNDMEGLKEEVDKFHPLG